MVIWFNNIWARKELLSKGHVFTLRPKIRKTGYEPLFYHKFEKRGTVLVTFIEEIKDDVRLQHFLPESGFESIREWKAAAHDSRFLYRVDLIEIEEARLDGQATR